MDIWVVFIFWLLWKVLQWTLVYKYLFESLLSILLRIYLGVELLGHMVILSLVFEVLLLFLMNQKTTFLFPL